MRGREGERERDERRDPVGLAHLVIVVRRQVRAMLPGASTPTSRLPWATGVTHTVLPSTARTAPLGELDRWSYVLNVPHVPCLKPLEPCCVPNITHTHTHCI